jgi:hypothetical protein
MNNSRTTYWVMVIGCIALMACKGTKQLSTASDNPFIGFSDPHIQYEGRVGMTPAAAELYWSGTTATIRFNGTGASAVLQDYNGQGFFNVIIDSSTIHKVRIDSVKKAYVLAQGLPAGTHTITLFKRTQIHKEYKRGLIKLYGFELEAGGKIAKPAARPLRKMEFYGNSVTCGHAMEDTTGGDSGASMYENNYLAYGALTARHFGARYRCIAKSGIGLMVSFGSLIMPEMYNRTNPFDSTSTCDFSAYQPDIVVVNLLQNDQGIVTRPTYEHFIKRFGSQPPTEAFIINAYQGFIHELRGRYPAAHIICVMGSMDITREGGKWPGYVTQAVSNLHDPKVYTHFFPWTGKPGHPRVKDHETMANSLITFIDKTIHW